MSLSVVTRRDGINNAVYPLQTAPVSQAAGTQTIVAAQPGLYIAVTAFVIGMSAAGTFEFAQVAGTTVSALTGAIPVATNGIAFAQGSADSPLLIVPAGDGLAVVAATGGAYGWVTYIVGT